MRFCRSMVEKVSLKKSNTSAGKRRGLWAESDKLGEKEEDAEKGWNACRDPSSRVEESSLSGPFVDAQAGAVGVGKGSGCFSWLLTREAAGSWFSPLCPLWLRGEVGVFWSESDPPAACWDSGTSFTHAFFPSLSRLSLQWLCFLCFIRLFWNHTFTWFSDKSNSAAISTRLGLQRYLLKWNSFSSSRSWVLVYAVLSLLDALPSALSGEPEQIKKAFCFIS